MQTMAPTSERNAAMRKRWTDEERQKLIKQYNEWQDLLDAAYVLRQKFINETPNRTSWGVEEQLRLLRSKGVIV
jgi:hypothetical protein